MALGIGALLDKDLLHLGAEVAAEFGGKKPKQKTIALDASAIGFGHGGTPSGDYCSCRLNEALGRTSGPGGSTRFAFSSAGGASVRAQRLSPGAVLRWRQFRGLSA